MSEVLACLLGPPVPNLVCLHSVTQLTVVLPNSVKHFLLCDKLPVQRIPWWVRNTHQFSVLCESKLLQESSSASNL